MRVEQALASSKRMLIRGEAGSGKTTLLKWLAINSARGTLSGELAHINGHVPFLVKLRSYAGRRLPKPEQFLDDVGYLLVGVMPEGFVHRQLMEGRVLVLLDGVDEVPTSERRQVRHWIGGLMKSFPDIRLVVTSRPAAVAGAWLQAEGFGSAFLERMSPTAVRMLIRHWHDAVQDAGNLPCDERELPRYEGALLSRLDSSASLRALATTPLLCAMLCALNLDRRTYLPRNRIELYRAALLLLLDRRDTERQIPSSRTVELSGTDRRGLLRYLAWRLSINGRSELSQAEALRRLSDKLDTIPRRHPSAQDVLNHLIHRSGVLREPGADRIDFAHRTFQDYLTAEEAADQGDVGLLVHHAHLDQWSDIVIMAAGLCNSPLRRELITGLLDRAEAEPRRRRQLRLLAASCLEAAPSLTPDVATRVEQCLSDLLPPASMREARSLATIGEVLLPRITTNPADLTEASAAATVRVTALINGSDALQVLERFSADPRHRVQRELISAWQYFDPDEYACRVLADAPLLDGRITVEKESLLPSVVRLRRLEELHVQLEDVKGLDCIIGLPRLKVLSVGGDFGDLGPLASHKELVSVLISTKNRVDPHPLTELPSLDALFYYPDTGNDISFLQALGGLIRLAVCRLQHARDLDVLGNLRRLESLSLYDYPDDTSLQFLGDIPNLHNLDLGTGTPSSLHPSTGIRGGIVHIGDSVPGLTQLGFLQLSIEGELSELSRFARLETLSIRSCDVTDFSRLASVGSLKYLEVASQSGAPDLTTMRGLANLKELRILSSTDDTWTADLSPLGNRRLVVRLYRDRHKVIGAGRGIQIRWLN